MLNHVIIDGREYRSDTSSFLRTRTGAARSLRALAAPLLGAREVREVLGQERHRRLEVHRAVLLQALDEEVDLEHPQSTALTQSLDFSNGRDV